MNIMFIYDICHYHWAGLTLIKYGCGMKNPAYNQVAQKSENQRIERYALLFLNNDAEIKWHLFFRHFKCIYLNENMWISVKMSWKFVPKGTIKNNPALVQTMAWRVRYDISDCFFNQLLRPCSKISLLFTEKSLLQYTFSHSSGIRILLREDI